MFEKVNPAHPDKIADRIAGALVDYAYSQETNPRIAVEVLIGHNECLIIAETDVKIPYAVADGIVRRIVNMPICVRLDVVEQDKILAANQKNSIHCGDNGIFKGVPITQEQKDLISLAKDIYKACPYDGKYIINNGKLTICQSNLSTERLKKKYPNVNINPLGDWTGGINVDCGATNRKLGSDMGDSITGGGLHGKDLSKADVSVNIYAWIKAQLSDQPVELSCSIGDTKVDDLPYEQIVEIARQYIKSVGGFEKFAEWGLLR